MGMSVLLRGSLEEQTHCERFVYIYMCMYVCMSVCLSVSVSGSRFSGCATSLSLVS